MPTKYSPATWAEVRERVTELVTQGKAPRAAAQLVAREREGRPAVGSIMNRLNNEWKAPGVSGSAEIRELDIRLQRALDGQTELREAIDHLRDEQQETKKALDAAREENTQLLIEKARTEGAMSMLLEVTDVKVTTRGHDGSAG